MSRRVALASFVAATLIAAPPVAGTRSSAIAAPPAAAATATAAAGLHTSQSPAPTITLGPEDPVPNAYVRGQILTIGRGFLVFTTGDALRLRSGTLVPKGTKTGSLVRATIDQLTRDVKAIELEPRVTLAGEVQAAGLGREYVVRSPGSAPSAAPADLPGGAVVASNQFVNLTLTVTIPANTPIGQDIYLSTDRSSFSPSEIRLQEIDSRHYTTGLSLPLGSRLRYQYTRGYNSTVERERNGDVAQPHEFVVAPGEKVEDTVARWADLN